MIAVDASRPVRRPGRAAAVRMPTDRELDVLLAYLETGRYDLAATHVGLSTGRVADVLESVRAKTGAVNTPQAIWRLRVVLARHERRRRGQQRRHENKV